jgi:hypothetical protein
MSVLSSREFQIQLYNLFTPDFLSHKRSN